MAPLSLPYHDKSFYEYIAAETARAGPSRVASSGGFPPASQIPAGLADGSAEPQIKRKRNWIIIKMQLIYALRKE